MFGFALFKAIGVKMRANLHAESSDSEILSICYSLSKNYLTEIMNYFTVPPVLIMACRLQKKISPLTGPSPFHTGRFIHLTADNRRETDHVHEYMSASMSDTRLPSSFGGIPGEELIRIIRFQQITQETPKKGG
jgi:hypothetical protein